MPRRAVVYVHEDHEGPGLLGPALHAAGYDVQQRMREVKSGDEQADLVVVMGGPMGVYQADRYPFLHDELRVLRDRLVRDAPTVGVCLGAQLLAAAAGSRVYKGPQGVELGVFPVMLTDAGMTDPIFTALPRTTEVAHWHGDTFDPVPGGVLLASSDRYAWQAFRVGRAYGVQFHPELDAETFGRWLDDAPDDVHASGRYVEALRQDDLPKLKKAVPAWKAFLARLVAPA